MKIEDAIKQKKFRDPFQKAVINLIYTSNWVQSRNDEYFKANGITPQQFNILRILKGQHPKSINATEIKSRMLDKNSDVSRILDRLVMKNLIIRNVCPNDKRAFDVNISEDGMLLLKKLDKIVAQSEQLISLSEEEATLLSNLLDKCRKKPEQ
jgi:DNA-binding MarR family transcriptional regulator